MWTGSVSAWLPFDAAILFIPQLSVSSRWLFVAGLLVAVAVVVWYWLRLGALPFKLRLVVVALRAISLLILVLAISDLAVNYQTVTPIRVLVKTAPRDTNFRDPATAENDARQRTVSALHRYHIEPISEDPDRAKPADGRAEPAAAVLISDGGLESGEAQKIISDLRAAAGGGPVYAVTELSNASGPRIELTRAVISGRVVRGVPATVLAVVHAHGMAGRETLVTVADNAQVRSTVKIAWSSDDETRSVSLEVIPKTAGWLDYTASVEAPAGGAAASEQPLSVYVEEHRWRVLMFEGEPSSESTFIRRDLDQSGIFAVDYFAQVSRDIAAGNRTGVGAPDSTNSPAKDTEPPKSKGSGVGATNGSPAAQLHALLADATRLNQYDCVIVGPTPNALLSAAEADRLRQWVDRRGGGLIILGGNNFTGSIAGPNGRLNSLLPALIDAGSFASPNGTKSLGRPVEAENYATFALVPTAAGADGALRGFARTSDNTAERRDVLAQSLRLGAIRPGGSVLAVAGDARTATSDVGRPLVAASTFGEGRVVLFAPADSFKLKVNEPAQTTAADGAFEALWRGLTLWTSAGAGPPSELALSEDSPASGANVSAEARVRDARFAQAAIAKLTASWQALSVETDEPEGPVLELEFLPDPDQQDIWRAKFTAPEPGKYILQATATLVGGSQQQMEKRFAVTPVVAVESGAAGDTLKRLTRATGGQVFALRSVDELGARLSLLPRYPATVTATWRLREFWPLAFLIPLLLAGEWLVLRLRL